MTEHPAKGAMPGLGENIERENFPKEHARRRNYVVTIDWNTGERTRLVVEAWSNESAKVLAMNQFPVDLHERMIAQAFPEEE
jgi:hypothetical protein